MKKIAIVGSGLVGCLTAFKIAKKFPKSQVYLIDGSNNILQSFKSIRMDNLKLNNGFHALDIDRCKELYNFFKDTLKVKFKKTKTARHLLINEKLIKENQKIKEYPTSLRKEFLKKKIISNNINILYSGLSEKLQQLIKKVSQRYSNSLKDNLQHFIPWFLPKEYHLKSLDEGDIYRNKIRTQNKQTLLAVPHSGLFETISSQFKKKLKKKKNIQILLNTKIFFENDNIIFKKKDQILSLDFDYIFICTGSMVMIDKKGKNFKDILTNSKLFVGCAVSSNYPANINFSEIICLNKNFIELSRISKIVKKKTKHFFLIEFLFKNNDNLNKKINKIKLQKILKPIFSDSAKSLKIVDYKVTRKVFFPKNTKIKNGTKEVKKLINKISTKKNKIFCNINFGPMNMAKTWIVSENNLKMIR
jgi:hypothetical protein